MSQMQMRCNERNLLAIESCGGETHSSQLADSSFTWLPPSAELPSEAGGARQAISASVVPNRSLQESRAALNQINVASNSHSNSCCEPEKSAASSCSWAGTADPANAAVSSAKDYKRSPSNLQAREILRR